MNGDEAGIGVTRETVRWCLELDLLAMDGCGNFHSIFLVLWLI